jgi:hypothetical protein
VRFLKDNSLSLGFGAVFLATLVGQAISGTGDYNADRVAEGLVQISVLRYVSSSSFAVDMMENWQSEYLQFFLFVFATVYLVQLGSSESKEPEKVGTETDQEQKVGKYARKDSPAWVRAGGWRTTVYSRSLGFLMLVLFLLTWGSSSVGGWSTFNNEQLMAHSDPVTWAAYLGEADFWNRSLQNWQSEMLAVGSMVIFTVYLRQRGSPESKPVGAPHAATGQTG